MQGNMIFFMVHQGRKYIQIYVNVLCSIISFPQLSGGQYFLKLNIVIQYIWLPIKLLQYQLNLLMTTYISILFKIWAEMFHFIWDVAVVNYLFCEYSPIKCYIFGQISVHMGK